MSERQIVHIVGSGHSGSTLLDMILGGHSEVSSLGEAYFLHFNLRNFREYDVCTCGLHVTRCPFWAKVEEQARRDLGIALRPALTAFELADERLGQLMDVAGKFRYRRPGEKLPFASWLHQGLLVAGSNGLHALAGSVSKEVRRHRRIARDMLCLYELVRRAHSTPVILDSTKNPGTFKNIYLQANVPMRFIFLVRDGRAVCRSRMRREGVTMEQAARVWWSEHRKRKAAMLSIPQRLVLRLHYEQLASDPEQSIRRVCSFLGIGFEPTMLEFRDERHNLGGNPMRFRQSDRSIRVDEAWRHDLDPDALRIFDAVAGPLNRRLGYE